MPPNPAPSLRQVTLRPTPKVSDLLFHELYDSRVATYTNPPEYGTAHPNTAKYNGYKLVFVEPGDAAGWVKWWYARDREDQDDYNYAVTYPYGGDESFPRYTRTYVIPRADYDPLTLGTPDPVYTNAKLVAQTMKPLEGQLGSLYVEVTRVYDQIPGFDDTEGTGDTQTDGGYTVERPLGTLDFLKVTWTITLPREIAEDSGAAGRADYVNCPIPGYEDLTLVDETIKAADEENQTMTVRRVYLKQQTTPKTDRVRLTPHLEPPDKFVDYIQRVTEDVIVTAEVADTPTNWDASPSGGTAQVQSAVEMRTLLDGRKVTVTSQYEYGNLTERQWDENLGQYIDYERILLPATTNLTTWAASNVGADQFYESTPLNRGWVVVTRATLPAGSLGSPALDYFGTKVFSWPRVLLTGNLYNVTAKNSNGEEVYTITQSDFEYKEPWSGICRSRVRRWWQKTKPTNEVIEYLTPTGIRIDWPIARINLLECLHPPLNFTGTTGTEHPDYGYSVFNKFLAGTGLRNGITTTAAYDWPASMIVDYDVVPYRGGYLCTQVDVYKPY